MASTVSTRPATADPRAQIDPAEIQRLYQLALGFADEARKVLQATWTTGFEVLRKNDGSFVTSADLKTEERLRALIQQQLPTHGILGEEYAPVHPAAAFQWILDPIDGTEDFVQRVPTYGSIIALHFQGYPLIGVIDHPALNLRVGAAWGLGTFQNGERVRLTDLDPSLIDGNERVVLSARANFTRYADHGNLFDAITRQHPNHRIYRSCFAHTCAITGAADAMVDYGNRIWDLAASQILVEEAGGKYVMIQDVDVPRVGRVLGGVFGKPTLVDRLVRLLR
jgi:fructose-1,6-bisphosphatase/inositol monophosphatase family enzyme